MQTAESNPLNDFLGYFLKSREAGLLIPENRLQLAKASAVLARSGFLFAKSWRGTLRQLALDIPVVAILSAPLSHEFFEIIQQYQQRSGMIQVMDRESLDMTTVHCNPLYARLLLIAEADELAKIESDHPIRNYIGMIELL